VIEQRVDCRRPGPNRTAHRIPDPDDGAVRVAAGEGLFV
jgi:hypothetical protein